MFKLGHGIACSLGQIKELVCRVLGFLGLGGTRCRQFTRSCGCGFFRLFQLFGPVLISRELGRALPYPGANIFDVGNNANQSESLEPTHDRRKTAGAGRSSCGYRLRSHELGIGSGNASSGHLRSLANAQKVLRQAQCSECHRSLA
ncbi:hypothetical protein SDC9_188020 [bioreactor metagenome]|uniref:Uncharacterized protein n=1 Tax=bioreactor metagenome TaxID=1076179 RepID=A0A645HPT9_9ZZZZ